MIATDPLVKSTAENLRAPVHLIIAPAFTAVPGVVINSALMSTPATLMLANTVSSRTKIALAFSLSKVTFVR